MLCLTETSVLVRLDYIAEFQIVLKARLVGLIGLKILKSLYEIH